MKAKPASEGGSAYPAKPGKLVSLADRASPKSPNFASPDSCHGRGAPEQAASGRVALQPRRLLCCHSSPSPSTCTAPSAGICTGRCRTSWRSPTAPAGASPPSARSPRPQGRPGARCPAIWRNWPRRASSRASGALAASTPTSSRAASCRRSAGVSHRAKRVSHRREEKNRQVRKQGTRERDSPNQEVSFGEMPDERAKWEARLRSWRQSRFWLPLWGPKPSEPGCFAPAEVLERRRQGRLTRKKGIQAQFAAVGAFLSREERTAHRKAMPASKHRRRGKARPRWVPRRARRIADHRTGPRRGRAARRSSAPALRAAGYRPSRWRHRLELGAVPGGARPARGGGGDPLRPAKWWAEPPCCRDRPAECLEVG